MGRWTFQSTLIYVYTSPPGKTFGLIFILNQSDFFSIHWEISIPSDHNSSESIKKVFNLVSCKSIGNLSDSIRMKRTNFSIPRNLRPELFGLGIRFKSFGLGIHLDWRAEIHLDEFRLVRIEISEKIDMNLIAQRKNFNKNYHVSPVFL